jgi:hypothetical protein
MVQPQSKLRWDRENTTSVKIKLNHNTDKDILDKLPVEGKQTQIKKWIREALKNDN